MSENYHILWADDEIDLLKPHLMFLSNRGYQVTTANNGRDALELVESQPFDLIVLDENMPGLTGLETLSLIKQKFPLLPVIMITKSEEENIMDQAVGNKIADYLIKPVNPNQILIAIKKILHSDRLVSEQASRDYREDFMQISSLINSASTIDDWYALYDKLVYRELELAGTETNMDEMLSMQMRDANYNFTKFVKHNYEAWVSGEEHPLMSHELIKTKVFPLLDDGVPVPAKAGVHEHLVDVLQPAGPAVDVVFALPGAVVAAGHRHLRLLHLENMLGVVQHQGDLGKAQALALFRAVEDHVLHLAPPEGAGGLLPHHPADGVGDVGLARAVGPHHRRDIRAEGQHRLVGEAFEALDFQRFQVHRTTPFLSNLLKPLRRNSFAVFVFFMFSQILAYFLVELV